MGLYNFSVRQGVTFDPVLKYSQPHLIVKPITGITKSGQAVITCSHNLSVDWPVWVVGVVGMTQINHTAEDLQRASRAYQGYYVAAGSIRLNVDSSRFSAYTSGGELVYHPPVDLTGYTATMVITPDDATETPITLTESAGITLGGANGLISPVISAATVAAWTWANATYYLNITDGSGVVTPLAYGTFIVEPV